MKKIRDLTQKGIKPYSAKPCGCGDIKFFLICQFFTMVLIECKYTELKIFPVLFSGVVKPI